MNAISPAPWTLTGIPGATVDAVWPAVAPLLAPCIDLDGGRYDEASVLKAIQTGDMQLWVAGPMEDGFLVPSLAVTTELRVYPCTKWCSIRYVGGKGLPFAFDFLGTIEDWARAQGCVGLETGGRPEWSRLLTRRGYTQRATAFQRKFDV